jgi:cytochrome P450
MKMLLGEYSIPFLNGKEWKHTRIIYNKALSKSAVIAMVEPIHDIIMTMIKSLDRKITENHGHAIDFNMETIFNLILSDMSGKLFFGMDFECCETLEQHPITETIKFMLAEVSRRSKSPFNPAARYLSLPTQSNRKVKESVKFVRDTLRDIINERRQTMLTTPSEKSKSDFITSALESLDAENDTLNVDKLIDILIGAHVGAFDSSSTTLVYIFYFLASNPFAENECLKEIGRALQEGDGVLNPDKLPYCNAVVTEALRLYPSFVVVTRSLEKPVTLGNVIVPVGMEVYLPFWHLNRDERHFHRANESLPERWVKQNADGSWVDHLSADDTNKDMMPSRASFSSDDTTLPGSDPNSSDKSTHLNHTSFREQNGHVRPADKNAFLTFSAGGRSCVGYKLARKELCLITVELLRHFKFELGPNSKLNPINNATALKNEGGLPVIISKRK